MALCGFRRVFETWAEEGGGEEGSQAEIDVLLYSRKLMYGEKKL